MQEHADAPSQPATGLAQTMPARLDAVKAVWRLKEEPRHWGGHKPDGAPPDESAVPSAASTGGRRASAAKRASSSGREGLFSGRRRASSVKQ